MLVERVWLHILSRQGIHASRIDSAEYNPRSELVRVDYYVTSTDRVLTKFFSPKEVMDALWFIGA